MRITRKRSKWLPFMVLMMVLVFSGLVFADPMKTRKADAFNTNGDGPISGWHWLRRSGHMATWQWNPVSDKPNKACINFQLLVTNKTSGGSGYDCKVNVLILDLEDKVIEKGAVQLHNPFRPRNPQDTQGIGYPAYGAYCSPHLIKLLSAGVGFKVRIEWPPKDNQHHVAVAADKAELAYTYGVTAKERKGKR
jgi:hypothetical protein